MKTHPIGGAPARTGLVIVCFLTAWLAAPGPMPAQEQVSAVVAGSVTGPRGQPQRVLVSLLAPGEILVGQTYTGSKGDYAFSDLRSGVYYITVEAKGFQPARTSVSIDPRSSSRTHIDISLEPINTEKAPPGPIVAGSRKSYALNIKEKSRPFSSQALREFEKGNQDQRAQKFPSAIGHYEKALKADPGFYPALNNLGAIYLRQKDLTQAESVFLKSLAANPEDGEAYINIGHVFYEEAQYHRAVERLEEGVRRSPGSSVGRFFLGSAYLKAGDLAKAEENLKAACSLDPVKMPLAHLQLANLYLKRHDLSAARVQLRDYLQINPSDPQAPAIKKMLDSIAPNPTN